MKTATEILDAECFGGDPQHPRLVAARQEQAEEDAADLAAARAALAEVSEVGAKPLAQVKAELGL